MFSKAYKQRGVSGGGSEDKEDRRDSLLDMAFLSMADGDYAEALRSLQKAGEVAPDDPVVANNVAVCHVYLGRLREGLEHLERRVVAEDGGGAMLRETPLLNLATIYELESSYAGQKKRSLLDLVARHRGDSVNAACLKLQ